MSVARSGFGVCTHRGEPGFVCWRWYRHLQVTEDQRRLLVLLWRWSPPPRYGARLDVAGCLSIRMDVFCS